MYYFYEVQRYKIFANNNISYVFFYGFISWFWKFPRVFFCKKNLFLQFISFFPMIFLRFFVPGTVVDRTISDFA